MCLAQVPKRFKRHWKIDSQPFYRDFVTDKFIAWLKKADGKTLSACDEQAEFRLES